MTIKRLLLALISVVCLAIVWPPLWAQVGPGVFSTLKTTSTAATSLCVGCPNGSTTPANNSGATVATVVLKDATPSSTTNKLYNVAGALYFNGLGLATGSSVSGTSGTVPKFTGTTSVGNSNATISGNDWTWSGPATLTAGTFAGSGTSLTGVGLLGSVNTFTAFGTHTWSSSGAAGNLLSVVNTTSGTTSNAGVVATAGTTPSAMTSYSQGYTTGSYDIQASTVFSGGGANGVSVVSGGGPIRFWPAGTLRAQYTASGNYVLGSSTNITDSVGAPSIASGFGSPGQSITGVDYAIVITNGTNSSGGVVNFGNIYAHAPACTVSANTGTGFTPSVTTSTTQLTITSYMSETYTSGTKIYVLCRSF